MQTRLKVDSLKKYYPIQRGMLPGCRNWVYAVDGISFELQKGETLALVGESGCGKTTVGRCVLRLVEPTEGRVFFEGTELTRLPEKALKGMRRQMQIIFQDPYGSLTPHMKLHSILEEPLRVHALGRPSERRERVGAMLEKVGLRSEYMNRFPHEFSGGQRQRIAIARALMLNPKLIVADEPVSALDVSIQAQIINLMVTLQRELDLSYLFISHDLSVVRYMANRVAVMYLGEIIELAARREVFGNPLHPYTRALMSAVPVIRRRNTRERILLSGEVPNPIHPPRGCRFHPRCDQRIADCERIRPEVKTTSQGHFVACHLY